MDKEKGTIISLNMGINTFKDNLINLVSNSQLPVGVIYYILKDVVAEIEKIYNESLAKEQQELLNKMKKEQEQKEKDDMENHQE